MHVISGVLKNYEWGSPDALRPWTDGPAPLAELWFGVHPSGVSPIVTELDSDRGLGIDSDPDNHTVMLLDSALGPSDVPILVKLLAAAKPLSVQVHPSAEFAKRGFHHLNEDFAFADSNEKTELLYALTDFTAFAGWRDFGQVTAIFMSLSNSTGVEFFPGLNGDSELTLRDAFSYLVRNAASIPNLAEVIAQIPAACAKAQVSDHAIDAYSTVIREFPHDTGALLTLFMDVVHLSPRESIFVPAGVPHSYIQGTGIEVMTSSDNVLRLGLTPKPVFAELALEAIDFAYTSPTTSIATTPRPFHVELIGSQESKSVPTGSYRLILAIEDTATVHMEQPGGSTEVILMPGQAAVITSADPAAAVTTHGRVAVVTATG
jgi:mannose-6-phosphate isomerase